MEKRSERSSLNYKYKNKFCNSFKPEYKNVLKL